MLLSIITVCYNARNIIEETINSVISQTYSKIEYIVIDGNSKDSTQEIIGKYKNSIDYYVSEPDKGIYDAMNKGIKVAKGDYILFMNAGDKLYRDTIIAEWIKTIEHNNAEIYYGDVIYHYSYGDRYVKALNLKRIVNMMVFSHQSVMVSAHLLKDSLFDTQYRYAADYNFLLRCYLKKIKFVYSPIPISVVEMEKGATAYNFRASKREVLSIHKSCGYSWCKRFLCFHQMMSIYYIHKTIKFFVPSKLVSIIQNRKR